MPRERSIPALKTLRSALLLFWRASDAYARRKLLLALGLVAAGSLLAAFTPVALKLAVDSLSTEDGQAHRSVIALVLIYVLAQLLWRSAIEVRMMVHGYGEQRIRRHVSRQLFQHLIRLPLRFHLERKTGAMAETAEQGIHGYQLLLQHLVYTILPVGIELAAVAAVLIHFERDVYLLVLIGSAVAYAFAFRRGAAAVLDSAQDVSDSHIDANAVLTDSLLNHETVKYFDAEPVVTRRYDATLQRMETAWRSFLHRRATNGVLVATIFALSLGCSLTLAALDVSRGTMTIGDFVLVNAYVVRLVQPLEMLGYAVRDVAQAVAFLGRMLDLFAERTETDQPVQSIQSTPARGELEFLDVSFAYRQEQSVLKHVSFKVPAGRTVAVVGVSGSGKSSLIRLLFRLYEPDAGQIRLDGVPITDLPLSTLRSAVAVVPQDTVLFHDTIANNIAFGRPGAGHEEIEQAARIANLHEFISGLPEGYETAVGERGLKLSGGERQRVAIARAALKRPRIFVFDEATSSLDSRTESEILRNFVQLASCSTTLVIAHRLSTIVHADEIVVLDRGVLVERGTHEELCALRGHYAALWRAQQSAASCDPLNNPETVLAADPRAPISSPRGPAD